MIARASWRRLCAAASAVVLVLLAVAAPPVMGQRSAAPAPRRVVVGGMDLTGLGHDVGSATAPVVIVNFSDFGCPYCASFSRETYPTLAREFVATGKVFYKYVPIGLGTFFNGKQAARASECAAQQGAFWPMHERLFARQKDWKHMIRALPLFRDEARRLRLDTAAFTRCYDTRATDSRTERAGIIAKRLGLRATPTFFVNGRAVEGALTIEQFRMLLQTVLRDAAR